MASPAIPPGYKLVPDDQGRPPEGRGRAMAMQTFLARGGGLVKNRKGVEVYADGPMKGMTQAQAEADFENKWAGASGAIKDKYSRKAGPDGVLSPSEKTALTPAIPKDMSPAAVQKRRMAQYGHEFAPDGSVRRIGTPERKTANPAASPVGSPDQPIGTPEERAKVSQMMAEGENYATAGRGNDAAMIAAVASSKNSEAANEANQVAARSAEIEALKTKPRVASPQPSPTVGGQPAAVTPASGLPTAQSAVAAPQPFPVGSRAANIAAGGQLSTDDRMATEGKTNAGGVPVVKAPKSQAGTTPSISPIPPMIARPEVRSREMVPPALRRPAEATDGSPVVARPAAVNGQRMDPAIAGNAGSKVRINSLTGLPFGYQPGDALPASADAAMQQRGRDSQTRQSVAAAGAPPPRATVVTPAPRPTALQQSAINRPRTVTGGVEGRAADEMRRQAGINANPSTVNPGDPKKFFTGRALPLDQLVKRQTVSTPVRR